MQSQDKTRAYPPATTSELPSTGPDGHEQDESRKENDQTCCEMRLGAVLFVIAYTCIICSFVCCVLGAMQLVVLSSSSTLMSIVPIVTIAVNAVFCAAAILLCIDGFIGNRCFRWFFFVSGMIELIVSLVEMVFLTGCFASFGPNLFTKKELVGITTVFVITLILHFIYVIALVVFVVQVWKARSVNYTSEERKLNWKVAKKYLQQNVRPYAVHPYNRY